VNKVLIIDASILCVWLQVPSKDTAGVRRDKNAVDKEIERKTKEGYTFILPIAAIIETGNHITQATDCYNTAKRLADALVKSAKGVSPWAVFSGQNVIWTAEALKEIADEWPKLATSKLSMGDYTIIQIANYYYSLGNFHVEIFTDDKQLKAWQPHPRTEFPIPRRRQ